MSKDFKTLKLQQIVYNASNTLLIYIKTCDHAQYPSLSIIISGLKVGQMTWTIWVTWVTFLVGQVGLIHKPHYLDVTQISHVL